MIINLVKKALYQALLLQKVWEVTVQSENSAKDNYENTKLKFESGTVSEFDLLQAETRWHEVLSPVVHGCIVGIWNEACPNLPRIRRRWFSYWHCPKRQPPFEPVH